MNVTKNEAKVLWAIATNCFNALNYGTPVSYEEAGNPIWTHSINDAGKPSGVEGKALSGVCGSLVKKGLMGSDEDGDDSTVYITEAGWDAIKDS